MEKLPAELTNLQQEAEKESRLSSYQFELPKDSLEKARLLAKNPRTNPKILRKLSKSSDTTTCFYVATNPNSPIEVLRKLAREFPLQVLSNPLLPLLFIENPQIVDEISLPLTTLNRIVMDAQTPREILAMLVQSKHRKVREAARLHVNWSGEAIGGWQEIANQAIKTVILEEKIQLKELVKIGLLSDFLPEILRSDILDRLAIDSRWHIRTIVAENRHTPVYLLEKLAKDEDAWVRRAVAENHTITANLLVELAKDRDAWVRRAVAEHPKAPINLLAELAKDRDVWVRRAVAEHPKAPINLLEELAHNEDINVRMAVVWNSIIPASLLERLGKDIDGDNYQTVSVYPNTPPHLLESFLKNSNFLTSRKIAKHPHVSAQILSQIAHSIDELARKNVAENPNTPIELLANLLTDREMCVRVAAVEKYLTRNPQGLPLVLAHYGKIFTSSLSRLLILLHPQTPSKTLSDNCRSHSWLERYAAASHAHTPHSTLETLLRDGNSIVRAAAKESLHLTAKSYSID